MLRIGQSTVPVSYWLRRLFHPEVRQKFGGPVWPPVNIHVDTLLRRAPGGIFGPIQGNSCRMEQLTSVRIFPSDYAGDIRVVTVDGQRWFSCEGLGVLAGRYCYDLDNYRDLGRTFVCAWFDDNALFSFLGEELDTHLYRVASELLAEPTVDRLELMTGEYEVQDAAGRTWNIVGVPYTADRQPAVRTPGIVYGHRPELIKVGWARDEDWPYVRIEARLMDGWRGDLEVAELQPWDDLARLKKVNQQNR